MTTKNIEFVLTFIAAAVFAFFLFMNLMPRQNADGPYLLFRGEKMKKKNLKYIIIGVLLLLVIFFIYNL